MNKEQTIKIIQEAKDRGYVPEKKEEDFELPVDMEFGRQRVLDNRLGFNQALSELKLEKIIELAYERGREDAEEKLMQFSKDELLLLKQGIELKIFNLKEEARETGNGYTQVWLTKSERILRLLKKNLSIN